MPRQRQIKLRAASSLGLQPRPQPTAAGRANSQMLFWLTDHSGLVFHTGIAAELRPTAYQAVPTVVLSDHVPVYATFELTLREPAPPPPAPPSPGARGSMDSPAGVVLTLTDLTLALTFTTEAPEHLASHDRSEVAFFGSFLEPGTCLVSISLPEPALSGVEGLAETGGKAPEERGAKQKRSALGLAGKRKPPPRRARSASSA